jgi:hypothetical protein
VALTTLIEAVVRFTVEETEPPVTTLDAFVTWFVVTVMLQLFVFKDAATLTLCTYVSLAVVATNVFCTVTLLTTVCADVADTNTAVAVANGTSIRCHAVPSFAIAQSVALVTAGYGKNRFTTLAVFGVAV